MGGICLGLFTILMDSEGKIAIAGEGGMGRGGGEKETNCYTETPRHSVFQRGNNEDEK